jgi:hypothetical protein
MMYGSCILVKVLKPAILAGTVRFTREDSGFHHRPHVDEFLALGSIASDLILAFGLADFI